MTSASDYHEHSCGRGVDTPRESPSGKRSSTRRSRSSRRNGYDRTSFREIVRATGLSQAGLLHYFQTKEELFTEVLRTWDDRNQQLHDEPAGYDTAEGLVSVVRSNSEEPGLVRLFVAMCAESTAADGPARSFFAARYETLRAGIAADIRRQQNRGTIIRDLQAEVVASLLIAAADGLQIQWLLEPTRSTWARNSSSCGTLSDSWPWRQTTVLRVSPRVRSRNSPEGPRGTGAPLALTMYVGLHISCTGRGNTRRVWTD